MYREKLDFFRSLVADPIIKQTWSTRRAPGFYLLDEDGVIQKRWFAEDVDPAVMERSISKLLTKMAQNEGPKN